MTSRMYHNLSEQREDWLEMPVLYIKYKQEEKWHGNYINMLKRKKEKERKIAGKRHNEPGLKENLSQGTE